MINSYGNKDKKLSTLLLAKKKGLSCLKRFIAYNWIGYFSLSTMMFLNNQAKAVRSLIENSSLIYQFDTQTYQLQWVGCCTSSTLGLYAVVQADLQNRLLFTQSATGLRLGSFSIAYQMQAWGHLGNGRVSLRWSKRLTHAGHDLAYQPVYFYRSLRWEDFDDRQVSRHASVFHSAASVEIKTASIAHPSVINLPEARLSSDKTGRYLSVEADEVDLGLLASRVSAHPQIEVVQVCAEKLEFPTGLTFPCSLEICHRPSEKMNLSSLSALEREKEGKKYAHHDLSIRNWRIRGDLAWYSPHDRLLFTGENFIEGDAVLYAQSVHTGNSGTSNIEGLHVQGSLGVFSQLWHHIEPLYETVYLGLTLETESELTASQTFMQLASFRQAFRSNLLLSKGGIFLVNDADGSRALFQMKSHTTCSIKRKGVLKPDAARGAALKGAGSFGGCSLERRALSSSGHCGPDQASFFHQTRRHFYYTNVRPELVEEIRNLVNCWNMLRSCSIVTLFAKPDHNYPAGVKNQYAMSNPVGRRYCIELVDTGMQPSLYQLDPSYRNSVSLLVKGLSQFPPTEKFLSEGVMHIYQLYEQCIAPYREAMNQWMALEAPFFNEESFYCLIRPFLNYWPFNE